MNYKILKMEDKIKKIVFTIIFAAFVCVSCAASVGPHGASVAIAPPLPLSVELYDSYYVHGGYHYYHYNDRWYYSQSKGGPWIDLPRDHYPREVKYKSRSDERDWRDERGRVYDKDYRHDKGKGHDKDWKYDKGKGHDKDRKQDKGRGYDRD
jgi:hypothetical protein